MRNFGKLVLCFGAFFIATNSVSATTDNSYAARKASYQNTRSSLLSFNFQDISIRDLLQLIAKNSGLNFIISDSVKGNMSLSLQNVTWQQALSVVMRANGLDSRRYDNVLFIAPIEELATNDAKRFQAEQQLSNLAPPTSTFIHLKYANANDLLNVIKSQQGSLLSSNGQIGTDPRTNTIWIYDNPANVLRIQRFIAQLDIPTKQVLIEARIVSIDTQYIEELGIKWGLSNTRYLSGTLTGANQLRQATDNTLPDVPVDDRLNFNIPANKVFGSTPASAAIAIVQMGSVYLDMELSALEGENHAQVISNPRVITSNSQPAEIQTGEEIPYQEATSSGATSITFKDAVLSLNITPQITSDNSLVLKVKVTRNRRGTDVNTGGGSTVPAIDTEEVQSLVSLKNNQTVVLGGVYRLDRTNTVTRIPFLGSIPVVGNLFKHTSINNERQELLIFITPQIVNQALVMSNNEQSVNKLTLTADKGNFNVFDKSIPSLPPAN